VSDFAKTKVGFALAMVGLLYVLNPLILKHGDAGFPIFGTILQFQVIYYIMMALLGGAVYFFAIEYVTETPVGKAHRLGNYLYAMALLFPPVFAAVWLFVKVAEGIVWVSDSEMAGEVAKLVFGLLIAASAFLLALLVSRRMNNRDRSECVQKLALQAKLHLDRAEELIAAGHNDLAALEGFRSVESTLQRALLDNNIPVGSANSSALIPAAARAGLVSEEQVGVLHELRIARNRAVHGTEPVPDQDATWFLETTRKVLRSIHSRPLSSKDAASKEAA
jgi:hypothetical protein